MIATTVDRVPKNTAEHINQKIRRQIEDNVLKCALAGGEAIDRRLAELDREWDIERMLETGAASVILTGVTLGATYSRKFFIIPALVAGFLLQHAIDGWCPPLPVLRRLGFRTSSEIDQERYALKSLRGDFQDVPAFQDINAEAGAHRAFQAAER